MYKPFQKNISKTQFVKGHQCEKALWLLRHKPSLKTPPDDATLAKFKAGHAVGKLAQTLFPGGTSIPFSGNFKDKFSKTTTLLRNGTNTLYEAAFEVQGLMALADILHKGPDGWELYEVKSATSQKQFYLEDIAYQFNILKKVGIDIVKSVLIYINNQYLLEKTLNVDAFFIQHDLTDQTIALQPEIEKKIDQYKTLLSCSDCPSIPIGTYCTKPYDCEFIEHCWQGVPEKSIFNISGMKPKEKFDLYHQGIIHPQDLPPEYVLTDSQSTQIKADISQSDHVDISELKKFLSTLYYPLCFLDFETVQHAIPQYVHTRPYQQVPFQYSLHVMNSPFDVLSHFYFLADHSKDP
ncbi:MAG: DUF2779 domain-containing protein, partial [Candidatus Margulisbacteria bacterium]|nr:DUF2779 domain-containing protein [Candidatus Margulisiibacteriota bacterium]